MNKPRKLLLQQGIIYGQGVPQDILIEEGKIVHIAANIPIADEYQLLKLQGEIILPGLVDIHTHLREPGFEDAETILTASQAAVAGGFTAICAMPNTNPVADKAVVTDYVRKMGQTIGLLEVQPIGAVTKNLAGQQLAEIGEMANSPSKVKIFSDDGQCVFDPVVMRRALEYAADLGVVIAQHAQEPIMTTKSTAHEGEWAMKLGLIGWPRVAEESIIARDIMLARDYGGRLHICHVSTAGSVELIRRAKEDGINVTAEVTPHHLFFTHEFLQQYDPMYKVNPPLREESDVEALRQGLLEGVIDCVATDHAPHTMQSKATDFAAAKPGMLGLQSALAVVASVFVDTGKMTWRQLASILSEKPAQIAGLPQQGKAIQVGEIANLITIKTDTNWSLSPINNKSLSNNNPYFGINFSNQVTNTIYQGKLVFSLNGENSNV